MENSLRYKLKSYRVVFVSAILTHYRLKFHNSLRDNLEKHDIKYELYYGHPHDILKSKQDNATLSWGTEVNNNYINIGHSYIVWQNILRAVWGADLLVLGQENKYLVNYILQIIPRLIRPRIAFFGHGRNFQALNPKSTGELWKRFWATRVDWWFGYTEETRRHLVSLGFPNEKITVFQNAIDTVEIEKQIGTVTLNTKAELKLKLGINTDNIGVYVGGMYQEKRIDFLIKSLVEIRKIVPDFEFIAIGGGVDAHLMSEMAASYPWVHYVGPKFGQDKTDHVSLALVFLMPGLVGLSVIDSFVYGTPMVTTDLPYHSPEIAYLEDGKNGIIVKESDDPVAYAKAVARILTDSNYREKLVSGANEAKAIYTIENMADRFSQGVLEALKN